MDERPALDRAQLTRFLNELAHGDGDARQTLMPRVHAELLAMAQASMRSQDQAHTLQPTALVNEAYLRLFDCDRVPWGDRTHFFALAAKAMRHILVDHARARRRLKRGGDRVRVTLDSDLVVGGARAVDVMDIDEALGALRELDERQAQIVELRFFGGLDVAEVSDLLEVSKSTIEREWRAARAWLGVRLGS